MFMVFQYLGKIKDLLINMLINNISYKLFFLIANYRIHFFISLSLMFMTALFEVFSLAMILPIINTIINPDTYLQYKNLIIFDLELLDFIKELSRDDFFYFLLISFFIIILIKNVTIYSKNIFDQFFTLLLRRYWSKEILQSYILQDFSEINFQQKGKLINNILNESSILAKYFSGLLEIISKSFILIGILIMLAVINLNITLIALTIILFLSLVYLFFSAKSAKIYGKRRLHAIQSVTSSTENSLNAFRLIKIFRLESFVLKNYRNLFTIFLKATLKIQLIKHMPKPLSEILIVFFLTISMLIFNNFSINEISIYIPLFTVFILSFLKISTQVSYLLEKKFWLSSYRPTVDLIYDILKNKKVKVSDTFFNKNDDKDIIYADPKITLQNISFKIKNKLILKNINYEFLSNNIYFIKGISGSGKSTLMDIIFGIMKPTQGEVLINNENVMGIDRKIIKKKIGYLSQDVYFLNDTIINNIKLNNDYTMMEVEKVCKELNIYDFILNKTDNFNFKVGDKGVNLSGGQKQKISITRSLIHKPQIILLDEPTNSLDAEYVSFLKEYLLKVKSKNNIIIFTSHDSSMQDIADQTLTLN